MTKNTSKYYFVVTIIILSLQFVACQSTGELSGEGPPQILPTALEQELSQTNTVPAVTDTPPVSDVADKMVTLEPTLTLTIVPVPSPTSTPIPSVNPTATSEPVVPYQLAFVVWPEEGNSHGVWTYSSETQESTLVVPAEPDIYIDPIIQLRPDKAAIGYTVTGANGMWAIWEVEIDTGKTTQLTPYFSSSEYYGFLEGWSPDQQWLYIRLQEATGLQEKYQIALNLNTQESIEVDDFALAWSPVIPNRYFSIGQENETHILKVVDIGGDSLNFQAPKQQLPGVARWGPDGQKIAFGLGGSLSKPTSFYILDLETGLIQSILDENLQITDWSLDGKWVAFNDDTGLVFFNSQNFTSVALSEFDSEQLFPIAWLDAETFLIQLDKSISIVNPERPESVVELIQLNDLYPNLDPFTHIIAWMP
jgi:dipeptidyl aminopeptidase/acylaminoacyl peptidase